MQSRPTGRPTNLCLLTAVSKSQEELESKQLNRIMTKLSDRYSERDLEGFKRKIATGFLGQTSDIVPAILFLADPVAPRYIIGQVLHVDGGMSVDQIIDCMYDDEF